jgi:hypothetical protein
LNYNILSLWNLLFNKAVVPWVSLEVLFEEKINFLSKYKKNFKKIEK